MNKDNLKKYSGVLIIIIIVVVFLFCNSFNKDKSNLNNNIINEEISITIEEKEKIEEKEMDKKEEQKNEDRNKYYNSFEEDVKLSENFNIYKTTAKRLEEKINDKETFVVLILNKENNAKERILEIFKSTYCNISPDFKGYYLEEELGYDSYGERINSIEPIINHLFIDDNKFESPYHYGIYEFREGKLNIYSRELGIYDPNELSEDILLNIEKKIEEKIRMVVGNLPSSYNFENILYNKDEFEKFIFENPNSIIYVGRDSCPFCPIIRSSLNKIMDENKFIVPVAYLSAQNYAISSFKYGSDSDIALGLKEEWENLKIALSIETVPYILVYKDGKIINKTNEMVVENDLLEFLIKNNLLESGVIK